MIKWDFTLQNNQTGGGSIANSHSLTKSQIKMTLTRWYNK